MTPTLVALGGILTVGLTAGLHLSPQLSLQVSPVAIGLALGGVTAVCWGASDALSRVAMRGRPVIGSARAALWLPLGAATASAIALSPVIAADALARGSNVLAVVASAARGWDSWAPLLAIGLLLAMSNLALAMALSRDIVAVVSPIANSSPIVTALLGLLLGGLPTLGALGGLGLLLVATTLLSARPRMPMPMPVPVAPSPLRAWAVWRMPATGALAPAPNASAVVSPLGEGIAAEQMGPLVMRPHAVRTDELLRFSPTPRRLRAHARLAVGVVPALVAMLTVGVSYWVLGRATAGAAPLQALQEIWWTRLFVTLALAMLLLGWTVARLSRRGRCGSKRRALPSSGRGRMIGFTLLIGALDAVAVTAFVAGARIGGVTPVASGASLSVGVAVALGAICFGERPRRQQWLGAALALIGLATLAQA